MLETPGLPFPWKVEESCKRELIAANGDNIADFVDTGSTEDEVLCALAAHCSQHLPKLIRAVSDYIEGAVSHTPEALTRLREAAKAANEVQGL